METSTQRPVNPVTQITLQQALEDLEALKSENKSKQFIAAFAKIDSKPGKDDKSTIHEGKSKFSCLN